MRKIITLATLFIISCATTISAQDTTQITIATDIVSQYIWRGQDLGNISLQPTLGIQRNGLSISAWSSVGLSDPTDTKEFDITLSYTIGKFNIGVTDYWFNEGLDPDNRYFKYQAHSTNHLWEANVGFDFGHVALQWYTNFAGNDGANTEGKRAYSSYIEITAPFSAATIDWKAAIGCVPFATTFYDVNRFAITNMSLTATKEITITNSFSLPIFGQIAANPRTQKAYFVAGLTIGL